MMHSPLIEFFQLRFTKCCVRSETFHGCKLCCAPHLSDKNTNNIFFLDVLYGQYLSQQNNTLYEQANESLMLFFMVF